MGTIANFRNLRKVNGSGIPAYWICQIINLIFKLLSANQIALKNFKPIVGIICVQFSKIVASL